MRTLFHSLLAVVICAAASAAQSSPPAAAAVNLPSEAAVNSFLQATFGYESQVSWKISSIKPAPGGGLAEVDVVLATPQGQQMSRFYVTPDGEHAVVGEIIPFGAKPF